MENQDTFSRITLSGRSSDNLENSGRPNNPPVSLIINQPTVNFQPPIACPTKRSRLPNDNRPAIARLLPPAAAISPHAGTPFLTGTSS